MIALRFRHDSTTSEWQFEGIDETALRGMRNHDAYLDALFGGRSPGTRRLLDLATIVAPLKLAVEARALARALNFPHPHINLTVRLLAESLNELAAARPTATH